MMYKTAFNVFKTHFQFYVKAEHTKQDFMFGMGNRCKDGKYVLFLDYDKTPLQWVEEEIRLLQSCTPLGTAYVFRTRKGYHVVFLEKFVLGTIINMLNMTTCDYQYKEIPLRYGRKIWVLRSSRKQGELDGVQYVGSFPNKDVTLNVTLPERSNAHRLYLKQTYLLTDDDIGTGAAFDGEDTVTLGYYYVDDRKY